ncbi:MAG: HlyC/CorC family transporter [Erysipelotrichaceae bacterium]|nr:HlyC/CorC family transporter [Erysipelotrichaceae bacterium]
MPDYLSWILIGLCLLGHFFFSASETALASCNRFRMSVLAEEGNKSAKLVNKVVEKFDRALTSILIWNNIFAVGISSVATLLFYNYLAGTNLEEYVSIISSIIFTFVVYIFADTLPKTIAKAIPDTLSLAFIYPIYWFTILIFPITIVFEKMMFLIEKMFKVKDEQAFTQEDFENVVDQIEEEGMIEEENSEIIRSAFEFIDTSLKDVITYKDKMYMLNIDDLDKEKLITIIKETTYSRIPIYKGDDNNYIGVLNVKSFVEMFLENPDQEIEKYLQNPYFVNSNIDLLDLLNGFKNSHTHLALVKKEDQVIGMVTLEDVLEVLVEDISEPNRIKRSARI